MKRYEIHACGYMVTVKASSYHTAISRALRQLKQDGDYKEGNSSLSVRAVCLGPIPSPSKEKTQ